MASDDRREQVLLRLDSDIKQRLRQTAKRERRSMSMHVEAILDEHLPPMEDEAAPVAS